MPRFLPSFGGAHLPLFWVFAWRLWPLDGPGACSFLGPYLGFFPLASSVGCWLGVVRFILGCPPSVPSLRRLLPWFFGRVLVGLPSWCCCAFGLLGPVVLLVCMLGHLSLVRSVFFLSHDRDVALPPLVGFAFGLRAVPLPQAAAVGFGLRWSARLSGLLQGRC